MDRFRSTQVISWYDCFKSWRTSSWVGNLLAGASVRVVGVLVEGAAVLGFDMSLEVDKDIQESEIEPKTWVSGDVAWYPLSSSKSLSRKTEQDEHICGILDSSSLSFTGSTSDAQDYDVTQSYALSYDHQTASFFGRNSTEDLEFPNLVFGNIVPEEYNITKQSFLALYNTLRLCMFKQTEKEKSAMASYCKDKLKNLSNLLSNFGLAQMI